MTNKEFITYALGLIDEERQTAIEDEFFAGLEE